MNSAIDAIVNHLWQSTLVVVFAGLLMSVIRNTGAHVRYWTWFAASVKFLVPFAALASIGRHIRWSAAASLTSLPDSDLLQVVQFAVQPASPSNVTTVSTQLSAASSHAVLGALVAVWSLGFSVVLAAWFARSRQVAKTVRASGRTESGREVRLLRRTEMFVGTNPPLPFILSSTSPEPGVFGIIRPVLIWPEFLSAHLSDQHIEAILAHELSHVRRHDNLTAALHMFVEAVFWFYPIVWWLGGRLMSERELACDEAVIRGGRDRRVYAESILRTCERCVQRPVACVAGIGRSNLSQRMEVIMKAHSVPPMAAWKRLALGAAVFPLVVLPIAYGMGSGRPARAQSDPTFPSQGAPSFQSASIQINTSGLSTAQALGFPPEGRFFASNVSLLELIKAVYGHEFLGRDRVVGGPEWVRSERFDVSAQAAGDPLPDVRQLMVRTLLAERFRLAVHVEHRDVSAYALTVSAADPNSTALHRSAATCPEPGAPPPPPPPPGISPFATLCGVRPEADALTGDAAKMWQLALLLGPRVGRTVVDRTGLEGRFNFTVDWSGVPQAGPDLTAQTANRRIALMTALRDQLGLELVPETANIPILVIDAAERPALNQ